MDQEWLIFDQLWHVCRMNLVVML